MPRPLGNNARAVKIDAGPDGGAPYSPAGKIPKIGKNPEKIRFSLTNGGKRTIIYKVILSLGFPGPENSEIISERKLKYV